MWARHVLCVSCLVTTLGCGDGIGRPIVERDPASSGANGSGGSDSVSGGTTQGGYPAFGGRGAAWGGRDGSSGVPPGEACARAADWPAEAEAAELSLFEFLTFAREFGFSCSAGATGVALPTVVMKPELRCAARLHSRDMVERAFFDHVNPDGIGPEDRMRRAGYSFRIAGESIARGAGPSEGMVRYEAFEELFSAGGSECKNLVDPGFDSVGIGLSGDLWTLDFAGP